MHLMRAALKNRKIAEKWHKKTGISGAGLGSFIRLLPAKRVDDAAKTYCGNNHHKDRRTWVTEKALAVLNKKPEALSGNETMGDKIISAVKDGTPGVIAGAVTNLLTLGVGLVTS